MGPLVALFLLDVTPDFVSLHVPYGQVLNLAFHHALAALPGEDKQTEDGVTMYASHALYTPHAHAFDQQLQDVRGLVERQPHLVQGALVICGEGLTALIAAEALKAVSVFPKAVAFDEAGVAGHGLFPLVFWGGKPQTGIWRLSVGLVPDLGLAPFSVPAEGGAPLLALLWRCHRDFHGGSIRQNDGEIDCAHLAHPPF